MNAIELGPLPRAIAAEWVAREERIRGSRMAAYEVVAQTIGVSSSWLRKFIGEKEAKQPSWTTGWNIVASYQRICSRLERAAENQNAKARVLERQIDAINSSAVELMARMAKTKTSGESD